MSDPSCSVVGMSNTDIPQYAYYVIQGIWTEAGPFEDRAEAQQVADDIRHAQVIYARPDTQRGTLVSPSTDVRNGVLRENT